MLSLTIHIRHVRMYSYFYWHMHDFGHVYVGMCAQFFLMIFETFQNFDRFFIVYIYFKETVFFNFSYKLSNKYFSLPQSTLGCH